MINANEQLLQHIAHLEGNPHFEAFLEHVRKSAQAAEADMLFARRTKDIRRSQGRAIELNELLTMCDSAAEHLKAIAARKEILAGIPDEGSGDM